MLRHSFIHASGVGSRTERWLWDNGVRHWDDLGAVERLRGVGPSLRRRLTDSVAAGRGALQARDSGYFQRRLPSREGWRIYGEFHGSARFLDIETDGLSFGSAITVIGVSDGRSARAFVAGRDLERFARTLEGAAVLVTFNGKGFDVPFIRRTFPRVAIPPAHIDLMHLMRGLGLRGGLKRIERELGLDRGELDGIGGADAVALWRRHRAGDRRALELLVRYNLEDVANLRYLMEWAYNRSLAACGGPGAPFELQRSPRQGLDGASLEMLRELRRDSPARDPG
jgi:uncharacterized protein YprB with RNaseH-like and TPR domain